jgi:hypothetical protein
MDTLEKLFGSASKVKVMRLFIFNPDHLFDLKTIALRTRLTTAQTRKELALLHKMKLIKSKGVKSSKKIWFLNESFVYLKPLRELMTHTIVISYDDMVKKISRVCKLKSLVLSGLFINNPDSRVDMLIIGNQFQKDSLKTVMKKIESEIGKELSFAILETEDFKYRLGVGDRLVRDILEYPHQVAFDRIGLV